MAPTLRIGAGFVGWGFVPETVWHHAMGFQMRGPAVCVAAHVPPVSQKVLSTFIHI